MDIRHYLKFEVSGLDLNEKFHFFFISNPDLIPESNKKDLCLELGRLTKKSWGDFGVDFINDHVIKSKFLIIITADSEIIGYASLSEKFITSKKYYYFEFLVIDPEYQGTGLSNKIIKLFFKKLFFKNLFSLRVHFNLITITPNPKIVGMIYRRSTWMYPNPIDFDGKKTALPNEKTWEIAEFILKTSYNPQRMLEKEALVLNNSYDSTPWLIYNPNNVPQDTDSRINKFCQFYLQYDSQKGKEFIVIAKINLLRCIL